MRVIAGCVVALCLIASPAMARANGAADGSGADASASTDSATTKSATAAKPEIVATESDVAQLKDLIEAQSKQLQEQQQELKEQQQEMQSLQKQLNVNSSNGGAITAAPAASSASSLGPVVGVANATSAASGSAAAAPAQTGANSEPAALVYKGITLTPGGFMAAESVWRQHALSADVNTPFNSVPFPGSPMDHVSEFNASGRQSRISMLVQGKLSSVSIGGYYETDFLSAGVTSNYNQSNSYTLRQRQFWGQAAFNSGLTITAGQMWSLVTETKSGLNNRTEATPAVIDAQYNVGFSWARQYGFRVAQKIGNKAWVGFAVENPETTATFHGQNNNILLGAPGASGGLLNPISNYAFSATPDFVVKAAFEPGFGHYEIFGVVSRFRDRIYPCVDIAGTTQGAQCPAGQPTTSAAGAFNDTRTGGGVGANARVTVMKKVDLGIHFLGGDGVGRYGTTSLSDVTARPDGTLALIHSYQGLGTIEMHPTPAIDIYMYVGEEYAGRTQFTKTGAASPTVGYGASGNPNFGCTTEQLPGSSVSTPTSVGGSAGLIPGSLASCTGDTRDMIEGTFGFWHRPYKGSKGTIQWGLQYSYLQRNTWSGVASGTLTTPPITVTTNGAPHGVENMVFTSFRYYLP